MRYFSYVVSDDDITITKLVYSEEEILQEFWDFWTTEMRGNGYGEMISKEACIDDWVAYNWATPEDVYRFKDKYQGKVFCINEHMPTDPTFSWVSLTCVNDNGIHINGWYNVTEMIKC